MFRTTRPGSGHLPSGHRLPIPEWIEPTQDDIAEGKKSGRPAGLSVWEYPPANHRDACRHRGANPAEHRSFTVKVAVVRSIAKHFERAVDVVADPVEFDSANDHHQQVPEAERETFCQTLGAHSLIEGIRRPDGASKSIHRTFRARLADAFEELPESS